MHCSCFRKSCPRSVTVRGRVGARLALALCWLALARPLAATELAEIERLALAQEPGVAAAQAMAAAMREDAVRADQLPDPELSFGLESVPFGEFALDREPMTQVRVEVIQRFPAGDSRRLRRAVIEGRGEEYEERAGLRAAQVVLAVREAWVEWCYWRRADALARERGALLAQLRDALDTDYAAGTAEQDELLGVELEARRLDAERAMNAGEAERQWATLQRWAGAPLAAAADALWPQWDNPLAAFAPGEAEQRLLLHPEVRALDRRIASREQGIDLARQSYRPGWGVSLAYGARDGEEMNGKPLDDLYSAMVSVEMPLFPRNRQDREYRSAVHRHEASLAERAELLRALGGELHEEQAALTQLERRIDVYSGELLPLAERRVEGARNAYESSRGSLTPLIEALGARLQLELERERLRADRLGVIARLRYLLSDSPGEASS